MYRSATGDNNEASNTVGVAWAKLSTYLPDIRRNTADGWTSTIYVRNDGAEPRNVKVTFFNTNGSFNSDTSLTLDPNAVWINPLPPNNWQGSAIVEGSEEVSVVVVQERSSLYTHEAYAGVGNPAADVLVPLVHRHNGLNSSPATIGIAIFLFKTPVVLPPISRFSSSLHLGQAMPGLSQITLLVWRQAQAVS